MSEIYVEECRENSPLVGLVGALTLILADGFRQLLTAGSSESLLAFGGFVVRRLPTRRVTFVLEYICEILHP
jgi:hypothetical protein